MSGALIRIFTAALLCMTVLSLADGPMREVLRLGCAALLILVTVTTILDLLPGTCLERTIEPMIQNAVEQSQVEAVRQQRVMVSEALSQYIAQQGRAAGGICSGTVTYEVDGDGICRLLQADIIWQSGDSRAKEILRQALCHDFGLPAERIIIREEIS